MVPMYRLVFGMSAIGSTATSLFTIIPTSISGVITHVRNKTCLPKLGIAMVAIGYSAFNMLKGVFKGKGKGQNAESVTIPTLSGKQLAAGFGIGIIAGVASGYIGLGGGFIMVPLMLAWIGLPMRYASGTSLIGIMLLAIPGAVEQGLLGNIDYLTGIVTAIGTVPGAFIGARFVSRVPDRTLRILFSIFLGVGAVLLVAKELVLFV